MENKDTRIIEVNGIKMEVDLRTAKRIDQFKVGDSVKVLIKDYSDRYASYIGTIIGFDNFEKTPTIVIAYLKTEYSSAEIKFLYYSSATKDAEVTNLNDWDVPVTKSTIIEQFNRELTKKEAEIQEIKQKQEIFEKLFGKYFDNVVKESF